MTKFPAQPVGTGAQPNKFRVMSQFSPAAIQWLLGKPPCFESTEGLQGMQQRNPAADWANNCLVKVLIMLSVESGAFVNYSKVSLKERVNLPIYFNSIG